MSALIWPKAAQARLRCLAGAVSDAFLLNNTSADNALAVSNTITSLAAHSVTEETTDDADSLHKNL